LSLGLKKKKTIPKKGKKRGRE